MKMDDCSCQNDFHTHRKLGIFIGATKRDLSKARENVITAILEAGHIPSGMELWSAGNLPTKFDVERHLKMCDVHVVIVGARYGEVPSGFNQSFTEWEYNESKMDNRPILAFLLNDEDFLTQRREISRVDPKEKENDDKINRFRKELKDRSICKFFRNTKPGIEHLGRQCINAIHELINSKNLDEDRGWLRAAGEEAARLRDIRKNIFLQRIMDGLRNFSTLTERTLIGENAKDALGRVFWDVMVGRIRRQGYTHLFIESGTTLKHQCVMVSGIHH